MVHVSELTYDYLVDGNLKTDDQQVLSGVFKRDTHMILKVEGNVLDVSASNTKDEQILHMDSTIESNRFGGSGMSWSRGTSAICSRFVISYP